MNTLFIFVLICVTNSLFGYVELIVKTEKRVSDRSKHLLEKLRISNKGNTELKEQLMIAQRRVKDLNERYNYLLLQRGRNIQQ